MATVRFSEVDEFIEELNKDYPVVDASPILRITGLFRPGAAAAIRCCYLLATIINPRGELVKLESYCGDLWGQPTIDDKTQAKYEEKRCILVEAAKSLHLDVRAGMFEGMI